MMNDLSVNRVWALASLCFFATACAETSFSSGTTRRGRKPPLVKDGQPPQSVNTGLGQSADAAANTLPQPHAADTGQAAPGGDIDIGENADLYQKMFVGTSLKAQRAVDVVFAVDTSGSMGDEKATLEATMAKFFVTFETEAKTLDYHVYLIGENFVFPGVSTKITKIDESVSSNDALLVLQRFFSGTIATPVTLRPEALKEVVVITDDNATGYRGAAFKNYVLGNPILNGKTKLNGFVGLPTSQESATCQLADVGEDYIALSMDPDLGGLVQDLCIQDWEKLLKNLAQRIIQRVPRATFELQPPADPTRPVTIKVDGVLVGPEIVKYEPQWKSIVFALGKEPNDGAAIEVTYQPL